jgi:hypothetical protein
MIGLKNSMKNQMPAYLNPSAGSYFVQILKFTG